jgi:hypothetical protein
MQPKSKTAVTFRMRGKAIKALKIITLEKEWRERGVPIQHREF